MLYIWHAQQEFLKPSGLLRRWCGTAQKNENNTLFLIWLKHVVKALNGASPFGNIPEHSHINRA